VLFKLRGFTLIEVLVVIGIIGILSAGVLANLGQGSAQARDAERKADLRVLQSALELYNLKNGRYPEGCRGPGVWSGQVGTNYACPSGSQYIVGLAPEFIPVLPSDAKLNGLNSGYVYTTNVEGSVYKIMARLTVEAETVNGFDNEFKSCDINVTGTAICDATHPSGNRPAHCQTNNTIFQSTYALWGGFSRTTNTMLVERFTEDVICDIQ
jgi:prepilin-type N-terminal cleavage/methylation domain-containing protein